jgi:tripartite-type tricarboxylate transporter receptor subunit TctC
MKLPRRQFLHLAASAAAIPVSHNAWAQTYPTRPVRLIVSAPPGGATDILARLMGQWLAERFGQPFVVENRQGAGSNLGTEAAVRAAADGYTLLQVGTPNAINATLYDNLNFNFIHDIAPVAGMVRVPLVLEVHPSFSAKNIKEFIASAKANPGKINMASAGIGSSLHVAGELFNAMTGVHMIHVPYRGSGPALIDLLGGQVQVMFDVLPASIEYVRAGKLRARRCATRHHDVSAHSPPTNFRMTWRASISDCGSPVTSRLPLLKIIRRPFPGWLNQLLGRQFNHGPRKDVISRPRPNFWTKCPEIGWVEMRLVH